MTSNTTLSTTVGVAYIATGVTGIVENLVIAILMATDPKMRNRTYIYMINLAISDAITFLPFSLYTGVVIIYPHRIDPISTRIGALVTIGSWYAGCTLMVLASFSRYIQLVMSEKVPVYFTRRNLIISVFLSWTIPIVPFVCVIWIDPMPLGYFPELYTWAFRSGDDLGKGLEIFCIVLSIFLYFLTHICNIKSLRHIRHLRKQIQMVERSGNFKREVKLFVQCAITGIMHTIGIACYFIASALERQMPWYGFLIIHGLWYLNYTQNPIIYFIMNIRLRRRVLNVFCCRKKPSGSSSDSSCKK